MEKRQEDALLGRLRSTFGHSLAHGAFRPESAVPNLPAEQVKDLKVPPSSESPTPDVWTGLGGRYLEATKRHTTARERHDQVLNPKPQHFSQPRDISQTVDILSTRLVHISRQKQHANLDIIQHHADELDKLTSDQRNISFHVANEEEHTSVSVSGSEIYQMIEEVQTKLRNLEVAVVQARNRAGREKVRSLSTQSSIDSDFGQTANVQLQALGAVRKQLTAWLEDSLAVCSAEETVDGTMQEVSMDGAVVTTARVRDAYNGYVETRTELLGTVQSILTSPLPFHDVSREPELLPRTPSTPVEDQVINSEQNLIARQAEESLQQLRSYLNSSMVDEEDSAVELLHRLTDESHLLPAYPILAQSEKFSNAMKAFASRETKPSADRVTKQTKAWQFAAEAANDATKSQLDVSLRRGHEAIDGMEKNMEDIAFLSKASSGFGDTH